MMLFSERIQRRHNPEFWRGPIGAFAEKLHARLYAQTRGVRVPDLYWLGTPSEFVSGEVELWPPCVVKPTRQYSCRGVYLIAERSSDGRQYRDALRGRWVSRDQVNQELTGYGNPILVEEMISVDGPPTEYKFHMFGDHVGAVQLLERIGGVIHGSWVGETFSPLPQLIEMGGRVERTFDRPQAWPALCAAARRLAFSTYMRVDLYLHTATGDPVLGELTPTPDGGKGFTEFGDRYLGECWDRLLH